MATHRQIVEHPDFTASRRALDIDVRLLDEALEGVIDVIARKPEIFGVIKNTKAKLRVVVTRDGKTSKPLFVIYFSHDVETVTLEYIHRHDPDDSEY